MIKKTLIIILLFTLNSCGYEAIYSKEIIDGAGKFSIKKISSTGDREINKKIEEKLNSYTKNKKNKNYTLEIITKNTKSTISKNSSGDPTIFKLNVEVIVLVKNEQGSTNQFKFSENIKYNNNTDKFQLNRYEKEIKVGAAEIIANSLIFKIINIQ
tara:strand:- start:100 stop:567 length:468 start_codon:yes stop_codon:yes gene_type:complete